MDQIPAQISAQAEFAAARSILGGVLAAVLSSGQVLGVRDFSTIRNVSRRYECQLAGNGLPAVIIPVSGYTSRQYAVGNSFSEITIPGIKDLVAVKDRIGGTFSVFLAIYENETLSQRECLFSAPISTVVFSGSSDRQSTIISGYTPAVANDSPQTIPLSNIVYRSISGGSFLYRMAVPNLYLRTGDIVSFDDDTFTVGRITYSNSEFGEYMEIMDGG